METQKYRQRNRLLRRCPGFQRRLRQYHLCLQFKDPTANNTNWNFGQFTWSGATSPDWSNKNNWNSGILPSTGDAVIIPASPNPGPYYPTLTQAVSISTLTVIAGSSLTLNGFNLKLSSFTNYGNVVLFGTETVNSIPLSMAGSSFTYTSPGTSLVLSTWTYKNLIINGGASSLFNLTNPGGLGALLVNESLSLQAGTLNTTAANYPVTVGLSWLNTGANFVANASTVTFNGSATGQSIRSNGKNFANLYFNGSGYWTLLDSMTVTSTMTLAAGNLDTSGPNDLYGPNGPGTFACNGNTTSCDIAVAGGWQNALGTSARFIAESSTITFTAATPQKMTSNGSPFFNLLFNNAAGSWVLQDSMTVTSTLTITLGSLNANSKISPSAPTGSITAVPLLISPPSPSRPPPPTRSNPTTATSATSPSPASAPGSSPI